MQSIEGQIADWYKAEIIERIKFLEEYCHRLKPELKFKVQEELVMELEKSDIVRFEKGGYFAFKHVKNQTFLAEDIFWIENRSLNPENAYAINTQLHRDIEKEILESGRFPIRFHTHPVFDEDVLGEYVRSHGNLNTSIPDQYHSYQFHRYGDYKLILPEMMVLKTSSMESSVFICMYNGLVAPICLTDYKANVIEEKVDHLFEWGQKALKSRENQAITALVVLVLLFLIFRYPKTMFPILIGASVSAPRMIYQTKEDEAYFVSTDGKEVSISIPDRGNDLISELEKKFAEVKEVYEQLHR